MYITAMHCHPQSTKGSNMRISVFGFILALFPSSPQALMKNRKERVKPGKIYLVVGRMLQHLEVHSLHRTFERTVMVSNQ